MGNSDISLKQFEVNSVITAGYLKGLRQEEDTMDMNSSPTGTTCNDREPLRVDSQKDEQMKSFDVKTAAAAAWSKLPFCEGNSPTQDDEENENPEELRQSIQDALMFTKQISLARQQSLRECSSHETECSSISWFRHIPGRTLKRSVSVGRGVASSDGAGSVTALPASLLSKNIEKPPASSSPVACPPLEKPSTSSPRREKVSSPATDKAAKTRVQVPPSPLTPSLLSPIRRFRTAQRGTKDKRQLTRCLSTPVMDISLPRRRKTIQRCRTAPTQKNGTPGFDWESFASKKKEKKEEASAQTNSRQRRSKPSTPRRCVSHGGPSNNMRSIMMGPIMEQVSEGEQHPSTVKQEPTKGDALDTFNWKAWAKTQSRRDLMDEGSSSKHKSKRSSLGRQRVVQSERNLSSRKSTSKSLSVS